MAVKTRVQTRVLCRRGAKRLLHRILRLNGLQSRGKSSLQSEALCCLPKSRYIADMATLVVRYSSYWHLRFFSRG